MDEKLKEMIAIGASVTANCIPCIQYHFAKAREVGVTNAEIKAAVLIGRAVRKGAAQKWHRGHSRKCPSRVRHPYRSD